MPSTFSRQNPCSRALPALVLALGMALPLPVLGDPTVTSLLEVRGDGAPGSFLLICDGSFLFNQLQDPDPKRLVLDLPNVRNGLKDGKIAVKSDLVKKISVSPSKGGVDGTRVVFELQHPCPVTFRSDGDTLAVMLEPEADSQPAVPNLSAGVVGQASPARTGAPAGNPKADYVIGSEDLLEINVFEQPELGRTVRVSGDGVISIPLVGVIPVSGLTTKQAEDKVRDLLAEKYLTDPQVSVFVKEAKSKKISIVGAVEKPGTIEMLGSRTLLEAISEVGGLTQQAGRELYVLRPDPSGATSRINVDLDDLMINGNPELNIAILPGDVINVPIDRILHVYVDGAVRKPGEVEYKSSRPLNLLQAIAAAGGLSERASQKGIIVIRNLPGGEPQRVEVDLKAVRKGKELNLMLEGGDTVYVPETFF